MHPGDVWYHLPCGFTCNENVPLKHHIPLNTSLNSLRSHCVISGLTHLLLSLMGPRKKYIMLLLSLSVSIGLSSFSNTDTLSVFV